MTITCSRCGTLTIFPDSAGGTSGKCRKCSHALQVPWSSTRRATRPLAYARQATTSDSSAEWAQVVRQKRSAISGGVVLLTLFVAVSAVFVVIFLTSTDQTQGTSTTDNSELIRLKEEGDGLARGGR